MLSATALNETLTFSILWANSEDDKLIKLFLFFQDNRVWHFMQTVSIGDNLHEISSPVFYIKTSSAENFTQSAKH